MTTQSSEAIEDMMRRSEENMRSNALGIMNIYERMGKYDKDKAEKALNGILEYIEEMKQELNEY